jgi:hypothetical protein
MKWSPVSAPSAATQTRTRWSRCDDVSPNRRSGPGRDGRLTTAGLQRILTILCDCAGLVSSVRTMSDADTGSASGRRRGRRAAFFHNNMSALAATLCTVYARSAPVRKTQRRHHERADRRTTRSAPIDTTRSAYRCFCSKLRKIHERKLLSRVSPFLLSEVGCRPACNGCIIHAPLPVRRIAAINNSQVTNGIPESPLARTIHE